MQLNHNYAVQLSPHTQSLIFLCYFVLCLYYRYYIGIRPNIVVRNLDTLKQIMAKKFDCFVDRDVSAYIVYA